MINKKCSNILYGVTVLFLCQFLPLLTTDAMADDWLSDPSTFASASPGMSPFQCEGTQGCMRWFSCGSSESSSKGSCKNPEDVWFKLRRKSTAEIQKCFDAGIKLDPALFPDRQAEIAAMVVPEGATAPDYSTMTAADREFYTLCYVGANPQLVTQCQAYLYAQVGKAANSVVLGTDIAAAVACTAACAANLAKEKSEKAEDKKDGEGDEVPVSPAGKPEVPKPPAVDAPKEKGDVPPATTNKVAPHDGESVVGYSEDGGVVFVERGNETYNCAIVTKPDKSIDYEACARRSTPEKVFRWNFGMLPQKEILNKHSQAVKNTALMENFAITDKNIKRIIEEDNRAGRNSLLASDLKKSFQQADLAARMNAREIEMKKTFDLIKETTIPSSYAATGGGLSVAQGVLDAACAAAGIASAISFGTEMGKISKGLGITEGDASTEGKQSGQTIMQAAEIAGAAAAIAGGVAGSMGKFGQQGVGESNHGVKSSDFGSGSEETAQFLDATAKDENQAKTDKALEDSGTAGTCLAAGLFIAMSVVRGINQSDLDKTASASCDAVSQIVQGSTEEEALASGGTSGTSLYSIATGGTTSGSGSTTSITDSDGDGISDADESAAAGGDLSSSAAMDGNLLTKSGLNNAVKSAFGPEQLRQLAKSASENGTAATLSSALAGMGQVGQNAAGLANLAESRANQLRDALGVGASYSTGGGSGSGGGSTSQASPFGGLFSGAAIASKAGISVSTLQYSDRLPANGEDIWHTNTSDNIFQIVSKRLVTVSKRIK